MKEAERLEKLARSQDSERIRYLEQGWPSRYTCPYKHGTFTDTSRLEYTRQAPPRPSSAPLSLSAFPFRNCGLGERREADKLGGKGLGGCWFCATMCTSVSLWGKACALSLVFSAENGQGWPGLDVSLFVKSAWRPWHSLAGNLRRTIHVTPVSPLAIVPSGFCTCIAHLLCPSSPGFTLLFALTLKR